MKILNEREKKMRGIAMQNLAIGNDKEKEAAKKFLKDIGLSDETIEKIEGKKKTKVEESIVNDEVKLWDVYHMKEDGIARVAKIKDGIAFLEFKEGPRSWSVFQHEIPIKELKNYKKLKIQESIVEEATSTGSNVIWKFSKKMPDDMIEIKTNSGDKGYVHNNTVIIGKDGIITFKRKENIKEEVKLWDIYHMREDGVGRVFDLKDGVAFVEYKTGPKSWSTFKHKIPVGDLEKYKKITVSEAAMMPESPDAFMKDNATKSNEIPPAEKQSTKVSKDKKEKKETPDCKNPKCPCEKAKTCKKKSKKKVNEELMKEEIKDGVNSLGTAESVIKARNLSWNKVEKVGKLTVWKNNDSVVATFDPSWGIVKTGRDIKL